MGQPLVISGRYGGPARGVVRVTSLTCCSRAKAFPVTDGEQPSCFGERASRQPAELGENRAHIGRQTLQPLFVSTHWCAGQLYLQSFRQCARSLSGQRRGDVPVGDHAV
jgi:hypothetical protein